MVTVTELSQYGGTTEMLVRYMFYLGDKVFSDIFI